MRPGSREACGQRLWRAYNASRHFRIRKIVIKLRRQARATTIAHHLNPIGSGTTESITRSPPVPYSTSTSAQSRRRTVLGTSSCIDPNAQPRLRARYAGGSRPSGGRRRTHLGKPEPVELHPRASGRFRRRKAGLFRIPDRAMTVGAVKLEPPDPRWRQVRM